MNLRNCRVVPVAKKASDLAKRVERFLERERHRDGALSSLLDDMSACPAYLFGGIVRDIAFDGIRDADGVASDIDIVCGGRSSFIDHLMERAAGCQDVKRNRFGGYRVSTSRWQVDVWDIRSTWAFRTGQLSYQGPESILRTTITNWESILFRLDCSRVICRNGYFRDIERGYLDVVLEANPNPLGMYVRIMRAHADGRVSRLSERAANLLRQAMSAHSFEDFRSYESGHYGRRLIEERSLGALSAALNGTTAGEVCLYKSSETYSLL